MKWECTFITSLAKEGIFNILHVLETSSISALASNALAFSLALALALVIRSAHTWAGVTLEPIEAVVVAMVVVVVVVERRLGVRWSVLRLGCVHVGGSRVSDEAVVVVVVVVVVVWRMGLMMV